MKNSKNRIANNNYAFNKHYILFAALGLLLLVKGFPIVTLDVWQQLMTKIVSAFYND